VLPVGSVGTVKASSANSVDNERQPYQMQSFTQNKNTCLVVGWRVAGYRIFLLLMILFSGKEGGGGGGSKTAEPALTELNFQPLVPRSVCCHFSSYYCEEMLVF
jgi:hypothetical protein